MVAQGLSKILQAPSPQQAASPGHVSWQAVKRWESAANNIFWFMDRHTPRRISVGPFWHSKLTGRPPLTCGRGWVTIHTTLQQSGNAQPQACTQERMRARKVTHLSMS
uniref:Uncharacterized protein n=1 Tax=Eutreptiella gymnastica TaxID=73025 RepID=A0A7S4LD05_9EUGL